MSQVVVIMGVCGCGKTTVGEALAAATEGTFVEGDAFHPEANVAKMRSGRELDDHDRQGWLETLAGIIRNHVADPCPCFVGCSALKASYRDILRQGDPNLKFVWLHGDRDVLQQRMEARQDHFMPPGLLDSQLRTLEPPRRGLQVDIDQSIEAIVNAVVEQLPSIQ